MGRRAGGQIFRPVPHKLPSCFTTANNHYVIRAGGKAGKWGDGQVFRPAPHKLPSCVRSCGQVGRWGGGQAVRWGGGEVGGWAGGQAGGGNGQAGK